MHKFLFYNKFIALLYMFRALLCSKHVEECNKLIIKQEFVHSVGQLLKLYWDARSAKHRNSVLVDTTERSRRTAVFILLNTAKLLSKSCITAQRNENYTKIHVHTHTNLRTTCKWSDSRFGRFTSKEAGPLYKGVEWPPSHSGRYGVFFAPNGIWTLVPQSNHCPRHYIECAIYILFINFYSNRSQLP